eukprot:TRINITY_DN22851_c0_g2_i2.p1 TRINITY_DN22851_c0_g2~~TRINITY_DN22851_c0_g2_i2.p1  ORF type:complete len:285 (-),score=44.85 TRINITY_DN22851_c0_g2_i2:46-900(-)
MESFPSSLRPAQRGFSAAPDPDSQDPYLVLGVDRGIADADLKRAYLRAAKAYHPDMNPDDPKAKDRFQRVSQAYETLRNPSSRSAYDASGQWSGAAGAGGQQGADYQQAEDIFRNAAQEREIILEAMQLYAEAVKEEATEAASLIWEGKFTEAWPLIREHRALFGVLGVFAVLLRHPAIVGIALRGAAMMALNPAVFRVLVRSGLDKRVWQFAWVHLTQTARRQRQRLKDRASQRERRTQDSKSGRQPPPPGSAGGSGGGGSFGSDSSSTRGSRSGSGARKNVG